MSIKERYEEQDKLKKTSQNKKESEKC